MWWNNSKDPIKVLQNSLRIDRTLLKQKLNPNVRSVLLSRIRWQEDQLKKMIFDRRKLEMKKASDLVAIRIRRLWCLRKQNFWD